MTIRFCAMIALAAVATFAAEPTFAANYAITPDNPGGGSVQLTINSTQNTHAISQYIYGINSATETALNIQPTLDRLGGNRWTGYNWETNASNAGTDYLNESDTYLVNGASNTPPGQAVLPSLQAAATNNRALIVTVPMAGYVSADVAGPVTPAQTAPSSRWFQEVPKKSSIYSGAAAALSLTPNKSDGYVFSDEFVNWVEQKKTASQKVFYMLDNEPGIWDGTHPYLHPGNPTWSELGNDTIATAGAIKDVNPNALVFGGVGYGWNDFTSLQDAPDAVTDPAHLGGNHTGELNYYEYLLQKVHTAEVAQGRTLMDVLDLHWYPEATGKDAGSDVRITGNDNSAGVAAARVQAPRSLFDPTYTETSWITQYSTLGPIKLLPRVQTAINALKPGTKISVSEYNYGGSNNISGGIAEADALGIFADQNVYSAALWPLASDADSKFIEGAFKMYLNYDGAGDKFGDTSIASTTSDLSQTSIHASIDSTNPNRMVVVAINRTGSAVTTGISVTNDRVFDHAEVYQLLTSAGSSTNYQIAHGANIDLNLLNAFLYTMPANSVSTLVLISDGLPGDYNRDGKVDAADYVVWRNSVGTTGDVAADGNEDNVVDNKDYQLWRSNYGRTEGGGGVGSAAVPEPSVALLGSLAIGGIALRRKR